MSGVEWGEGGGFSIFFCPAYLLYLHALEYILSPVSVVIVCFIFSRQNLHFPKGGEGLFVIVTYLGHLKIFFILRDLMCLANLFLQHASYRLCILFHHISHFSICLFFYLLLLCFNIHQAVCWIFKYCFLMSLKVISFRHSTLQKVCLSFFKKMSAKMNIFFMSYIY